MPNRNTKSLSKERFGAFAQRYVESNGHAKGDDLAQLVALASPAAQMTVLDIATGGGHTALAFSPYVRAIVAADLTHTMLRAARAFHIVQQAQNITYTTTDAEHLAFAPNTFDLITCRIAPHHFPDIYRFVLECRRVLKPNGKLLIQDLIVPDHERAAEYIDAFERLRDPSHHQSLSAVGWRGTFLDAGLTVDQTQIIQKTSSLITWAKVQDCSDEVIDRLQILLAQAPDAVRDWLQPSAVGTPDAAFCHQHLMILGTKAV